LQALRERVDALIVVPNDRLMRLSDGHLPMVEAFRLADDVLRQGVQGIADLVTYTGLINLDFADVKSVMTDAGTALMAVGEATGDARALQAAHAAINSPLLDASIAGARGVLINITGGPDLTLTEVSEAANAIYEVVDPGANILIGAVVHPRPQPEVKLTLIATGLPGTEKVVVRDELESRDRRLPPMPSRDRDRPRERARDRDWDADGAPLADLPDPDDLDLPAFLRRRRQS
jgi:cell division protein FtsZ